MSQRPKGRRRMILSRKSQELLGLLGWLVSQKQVLQFETALKTNVDTGGGNQ